MGIIRIRAPIVGVEGEHADHLTTTRALVSIVFAVSKTQQLTTWADTSLHLLLLKSSMPLLKMSLICIIK